MKEMDEGEEKEEEGWGRRRRKGWIYGFLRSCERVQRLMSDNFTCCHTERGDHKKKKKRKRRRRGKRRMRRWRKRRRKKSQ